MAAQDDPDRLRVLGGHLGNVEAELETGAAPWHPQDPVAEASPGKGLAVDRGGKGDPCIRVQMVDVGRSDQSVHGRVDRGCRTAFAVKAKVEGGDHFVLVLGRRGRRRQRPQPVQPEHGQARFGQRAEVATRALHLKQLGRCPGNRVLGEGLARSVAPGIIGVLRVAPEPVRPLEQLQDRLWRRRC